MTTKFPSWPAWYFGPEGQSGIFNGATEVPEGWEDHPAKVEDGAAPASTGGAQPRPIAYANPGGMPTDPGAHFNPGGAPLGTETSVGTTTLTGKALPNDGGNASVDGEELDKDGWPWTAEIHAATHSKTNTGLWRMKVGATRPDPKPGFPKPAENFDL